MYALEVVVWNFGCRFGSMCRKVLGGKRDVCLIMYKPIMCDDVMLYSIV
jgi:hypothetical protein